MQALRFELIDFVDHELIPAEAYLCEVASAWEREALMADLQAEARRRGLWGILGPGRALGDELRAACAAELRRSRIGAQACGGLGARD